MRAATVDAGVIIKGPVAPGLMSSMAPNVSFAPISKPVFTTLSRASGDEELKFRVKLPSTSVVVDGSPKSAIPLLLRS